LAEIRDLRDGLGGDDRCWALTPGDTCPDNNVLADAGVVLFDFEGAAIRHVAWDAAYLRVPWPRCWFLAGALDGDDVPGGEAGRRVAPGRRALILHRLAQAARGTVPGLAAWRGLAAEIRAAAEAAWGPVELAPAPAFRRDTR
jgi:hypothetical protein